MGEAEPVKGPVDLFPAERVRLGMANPVFVSETRTVELTNHRWRRHGAMGTTQQFNRAVSSVGRASDF